MSVSEASDELLELLDQILFYLEAAEGRGVRRSLARGSSLRTRRGKVSNPLRGWLGIVPLHQDFLETFFEEHEDFDTLDVVPDDLSAPFDKCLCTRSAGSEETLVLHRFRAGGTFCGLPRVRWHSVTIGGAGQTRGGKNCTLLTRNIQGVWKASQPTRVTGSRKSPVAGIDRRCTNMVQIALALAYEAQRFWHVDFAYHENGPAVAVQTDARGVLELVGIDAALSGEERRDAILEWAEAHYRHRPKWDAEAVFALRSRLSTRMPFPWMGMHLRVRSSLDDLHSWASSITQDPSVVPVEVGNASGS